MEYIDITDFIGHCWACDMSVNETIEAGKSKGLHLDKVEITAHFEDFTGQFNAWCTEYGAV